MEKKSTDYITPDSEVIELSTKDGVMQFGSPTDPGSGGGEGIGGGTDL